MSRNRKRPPMHPGEILRDEFMAEYRLSANKLALGLRVPVTRISEIINGRRSISPDTAVRLARYFGTSPEFWLNLQLRYDLQVAQAERPQVEREVQPLTV
jgi:antitoxin HigA-1